MINGDKIVYVTNTGRKYHSKGCGYLNSCKEIELSVASKLYSPCSRCNPPSPSFQRNNINIPLFSRSTLVSNSLLSNSTNISNENQLIFSFNANTYVNSDNSIISQSDFISQEELKETVENKAKDLYEYKIKELERIIFSMNEKLEEESVVQRRLHEEKDRKIEGFEKVIEMLESQNDKMLNKINLLEEVNREILAKTEKIVIKNQIFSIERFDLNYLASNNWNNYSCNLADVDYFNNENTFKNDSTSENRIHICKVKSNSNFMTKQRRKVCKGKKDYFTIHSVNFLAQRFLKLFQHFPMFEDNLKSKVPLYQDKKEKVGQIAPSKKRKRIDSIKENRLKNTNTTIPKEESVTLYNKVDKLEVPFLNSFACDLQIFDFKSFISNNYNNISNKI